MSVKISKADNAKAIRLGVEDADGFMFNALTDMTEIVEELFQELADGLIEYGEMAEEVPEADKPDFDKAVNRFLDALHKEGFAVGYILADTKLDDMPVTICHLYLAKTGDFPVTITLPESATVAA